MPFVDSEGIRIYYDDMGKGEPVLLFLPGWLVSHKIWMPVATRLCTQHQVLVMDWRGHGRSQTPNRDFGYDAMIRDVLAVIKASGVESFITIAQAHGGWVAIELRRQLQERVQKMVFTSWNPIFTSQNLHGSVHPFLAAMQALQDINHWQETVDQLFSLWLTNVPAAMDMHCRKEMGGHGFKDWSRAGREILVMYEQYGHPLQALGELNPAVPVIHMYGLPRTPEYLSTQESFARDHSWFTVLRLEATSQFVMLESPNETTHAISKFID